MLKTLENRDQREKEYWLAALTKRLLPQPGIPSLEDETTAPAEVGDQLLHEIQTALKLDPNDQSVQAKTKVFEFLSNEMSKPLQSGTRMAQAKARLGQKGYLPDSGYHIEFRDSFRELEKLGIRRSHIEDALRSPDQVQHLRPEISYREDLPAISIYIKSPNVRQGEHRFTLLVITERKGDTQVILSAWRVYSSDVDISEISEPLVMLRAFVDVYGVPFRVGNSPLGKFFLYETFLAAQNQPATKVITVDNYPDKFYTSNFLRVSSLQVIEVALVYVIDISHYISDLRKHNVQMSNAD